MANTALIVGVTGQDGAYLAHFLLGLGYRVVGTSRDAQTANISRLTRLGIEDDIELSSLNPIDFRSVLKVVTKVAPDEIYYLAGQSSVGLSFDQPVETLDSILTATLNFLEVIRFVGGSIRFFNAGSTECFGDTGLIPATEDTPMRPISPYAAAKVAAYLQVSIYRDVYGIFACTGILANHESPLRSSKFVTQKIIDGVRMIKKGRQSKIKLGNLDIWRDWGWAPDYVKAMRLMLHADKPKDYLISSGVSVSLHHFLQVALELTNLDESIHVELIETLKRPSEITHSMTDPRLIEDNLGWKSTRSIHEIIDKMLCDMIF